jgi:superfamily II helicase
VIILDLKDELLTNELFETAGRYSGRMSELLILAAANIQEKYKLIEKIENNAKYMKLCNHKSVHGLPTLDYDSIYEMRNSEMHCTQCGKHGSREELSK